MKFIVASIDGGRVLCQFSDMAPVQWIDARVSEAIGYSYAIRFETRAGADRCAFIHNGAAVALGEWDHDTEANRTSDGGSTCRVCGTSNRPRAVARSSEVGGSAARGGPRERVPPRDGGRRDSRSRFGGAPRGVAARMPPLAEADWRARSRDARLNGVAELDIIRERAEV